MSAEMIKTCVKIVNGRVYTEASGNITLSNIKDYAQTGVCGISMGALTHSVKACDISLRFVE
jgi:nicotinate-nucleotide pyrophosphorylase (carboxylating)